MSRPSIWCVAPVLLLFLSSHVLTAPVAAPATATSKAPSSAPGSAASGIQVGTAAVQAARQQNPQGVAGASAAINSQTAVCSIPAGSNGGKLINAPTLQNTAAAGSAAVAAVLPANSSASGSSGRRLASADSWWNDIGSVFQAVVEPVVQVSTIVASGVSNAATSAVSGTLAAAAATVQGLNTVADATATGISAATHAAVDFAAQNSNTIGKAIDGAKLVKGIVDVAKDLKGFATSPGVIATGEEAGEIAEALAEGVAEAGRRRSLLELKLQTYEELGLLSRRLLAPALAPPASNTMSTSSAFASTGKNITVTPNQISAIPACCSTSALPAGATAASLEQQYGFPAGSVSAINADNAFSGAQGNITLPCPRYLAWLSAAAIGWTIGLPATNNTIKL